MLGKQVISTHHSLEQIKGMWWPENTEGIQSHQATTGEKDNCDTNWVTQGKRFPILRWAFEVTTNKSAGYH